SRRIIGQVMGEAVAIGIVGGAIGVGIGLVGAELVSGLSPKLSAVVGQTTGSATPGGARQFGFGGAGGFRGGGAGAGGGGGGLWLRAHRGAAAFRRAGSAGHSVAVHLSAAVSANVILLAVVLALAGGIIAGIFGGWRAARLRSAAALSKVALSAGGKPRCTNS